MFTSSKLLNARSKINTLAPNYRPRYQLEEIVATNMGNMNESNTATISSLCSHCGRCCCKCLRCIFPCIASFFCRSRKRAMVLITISAVVSLSINRFLLEPLALSLNNQQNFALAREQSYGFFDDIPKSRWKLLQKRVRDQRKKQRERGWRGQVTVTDPSHYAKASQFYQHHWQSDFTCAHKGRIGALTDGNKVLCNP